MSEAVAVVGKQPEFLTREQIELIKNTVAKGATDDELKMFTSIADKYGLDPLIHEIWFIKRPKKHKDQYGNWDYNRKADGSIDYTGAETVIMTSRDGYLKIAQRDPEFQGLISFPVREGDIFEVDAENYKVIHKFGLQRGKIIGAWAKADKKGRMPVITYADFAEYREDMNIWKKYPSIMIQKVAEVLALKRQFGINGLTTKEEMNSSYDYEEPAATPVKTETEKIKEIAKQREEAKKEVINVKPEYVQEAAPTAEQTEPETVKKPETTIPADRITKEQKSKIAVIARSKGLTDEEGRTLAINSTGKSCIQLMTQKEADIYIEELNCFRRE